MSAEAQEKIECLEKENKRLLEWLEEMAGAMHSSRSKDTHSLPMMARRALDGEMLPKDLDRPVWRMRGSPVTLIDYDKANDIFYMRFGWPEHMPTHPEGVRSVQFQDWLLETRDSKTGELCAIQINGFLKAIAVLKERLKNEDKRTEASP